MAEGKAEATAKSGIKVAKKGLSSGTKVLTGFRDFILRGNVVDLAVAIVVGTAFTAVVKALVGVKLRSFARKCKTTNASFEMSWHFNKSASYFSTRWCR